ncbi:MAG TPA: PA14 domain-containing protein [Vicinamibacterales bacterium]|nr:PA14 domain-containing protein [Vicinamibacterales bacterium]
MISGRNVSRRRAARVGGLWAAAAVSSLLSVLLAVAIDVNRAPTGLAATYETLAGPAKTVSALDPELSTEHIDEAWGGNVPDSFSATWRGVIYVPADGAYTFGTRADGESTIYLDGRKILENGWDQPETTVRETVRPDEGFHTITVNYRHNVGRVRFEILWGHGDETLTPIPARTILPRRISQPRMLAMLWLPSLLAALEWLSVLLAVLAGAATALALLERLIAHLRAIGAPRALGWIVGASILLNGTGLWWGLPAGWASIELQPVLVLGALSTHFMHGWSDAYPPVHFYVLSIALSPAIVLDWLGRIDLHATLWTMVMAVIIRLVSVAMGAGTLVAIYLCGQIAFTKRAGLFAAAAFALAAPFLYFAKMGNVDVPYLFWFALALVFYLLALRDDRIRDYVGLAIATALSIGTKDQAYGLFLLPPIVILVEKRLNRRVLAAGATAIAAFLLLDGLIFNFSGFVKHVQFITGTGSTDYRLFDPTFAGRLALLRLTARLTELTWGWPVFLISLCGVAIALADRVTRRKAIWLLAPVAGYYLGFLDVILYVYDRFTLPIALVLALFAGLAIDRLFTIVKPRALALSAIGAVFAYTFLYSATVDVLMVRDSRYAVRDWLDHQTISPDDLVAANVFPTYLPRLDPYKYGNVVTIDDLHIGQPKFFILNVDYTRGENEHTAIGPVVIGLENHELGYTKVFEWRTPSPWPWLPGAHPDLVGPRLQPTVVSSLRAINPTIEIFQHDTTIGR